MILEGNPSQFEKGLGLDLREFVGTEDSLSISKGIFVTSVVMARLSVASWKGSGILGKVLGRFDSRGLFKRYMVGNFVLIETKTSAAVGLQALFEPCKSTKCGKSRQILGVDELTQLAIAEGEGVVFDCEQMLLSGIRLEDIWVAFRGSEGSGIASELLISGSDLCGGRGS